MERSDVWRIAKHLASKIRPDDVTFVEVDDLDSLIDEMLIDKSTEGLTEAQLKSLRNTVRGRLLRMVKPTGVTGREGMWGEEESGDEELQEIYDWN